MTYTAWDEILYIHPYDRKADYRKQLFDLLFIRLLEWEK